MKRLLLLTAVLSASASYVLAQNSNVKTVQDANGNTYTYNAKTDLAADSYGGDTIFANKASFDLNNGQLKLTLHSDERNTVSNCNLKYNVKLTNVSADPGTIAPFKEYLTAKGTIFDVVVQEAEIVTRVKAGRKTTSFSIKTGEAYDKYVAACERAKDIQAGYVYKGSQLINGEWQGENILKDDIGGMGLGADINPDLYYMISQGENVYPITNVDGDYATGTRYSNATITYTPTGIADGYKSYSVSGDGKVGYVSGVVDNGKVEEILSNTTYAYVNFDFTNASILGSVNTNVINDNRIAYFSKNTDVTGQNFVVGTSCERYYIYDNKQEIYVDRSFSAEDSRYHRTFTPETYGSIVLPFTVSTTSNIFVKQAKLTDYVASENKLVFTSTESIAPNTPYMFKVLPTVTGESTIYGATNGTVTKTAEAKSPKIQGAQFAGTFEGLRAEIASQVYVIGAVGKIGRTTKALKPGRCYLTREDPDNFAKMESATIEIIDEDGAIEKVEADEAVTAIDGVVNGEVVSVQYISVNGQISNEPFSGVNLVKKTFEDGSVETSKVVY